MIRAACKYAEQEEKQRSTLVVPFARSASAQHAAENEAQVESSHMDQLPLEDVLVPAQMSSPHSSGIVTMREAPLDQLASFAQQALPKSPVMPEAFRRGT